MNLVLQATNRIQVGLVFVAPAHVAVVVAHVPAVGVAATALRGTPPVAAVADLKKTANRSASAVSAAQQGRKPVIIRAVAVLVT